MLKHKNFGETGRFHNFEYRDPFCALEKSWTKYIIMVGYLPATLLDTHVNRSEYTDRPQIRLQRGQFLSGPYSELLSACMTW